MTLGPVAKNPLIHPKNKSKGGRGRGGAKDREQKVQLSEEKPKDIFGQSKSNRKLEAGWYLWYFCHTTCHKSLLL